MGKGTSKKSRADKLKRFYGQALKSGSKRGPYIDPSIRKEGEPKPKRIAVEGLCRDAGI